MTTGYAAVTGLRPSGSSQEQQTKDMLDKAVALRPSRFATGRV